VWHPPLQQLRLAPAALVPPPPPGPLPPAAACAGCKTSALAALPAERHAGMPKKMRAHGFGLRCSLRLVAPHDARIGGQAGTGMGR
jgi:hypothetical protein